NSLRSSGSTCAFFLVPENISAVICAPLGARQSSGSWLLWPRFGPNDLRLPAVCAGGADLLGACSDVSDTPLERAKLMAFPYRADQVGSLLRPQELLDARKNPNLTRD